MKHCIVEVVSETATFRDPEFQNFHRTYRLPPPSTLVGIAGAALGKSAKAAQDFFLAGDWRMGICGSSDAVFKDLWKFRKLDGKGSRSVLTREILFRNHFLFVFSSSNRAEVEELAEAFQHPIYALTAGNSDSLLKIRNVDVVDASVTESQEVAHCWVPGDVLQTVLEGASTKSDFSIYTSSEPTLFDLPMHFAYQSEYGIRNIRYRKQFSFIGAPMRLNYSIQGLQHKDYFIPIFDYAD